MGEERLNYLCARRAAHNPEPGAVVLCQRFLSAEPTPHLGLVGGVEVDALVGLTLELVAVGREPGVMQAVVPPAEGHLVRVDAHDLEPGAHPVLLAGADAQGEELFQVLAVTAEA